MECTSVRMLRPSVIRPSFPRGFKCADFPFESVSILVACGVVIEGPQGIPSVFLLGSYPEFYATRVAPAKCIAGALVFADSHF